MKFTAIRENHLYQKTFHKGSRRVGKLCAVYVLRDYAAGRLRRENPEKKYLNRIGLSVTKKNGGAVQRNRAKRLLRAGMQPIVREENLKTGNLIVLSARTAILDAKSYEVEAELRESFAKLGMFRAEKSEKS